MVKSGVPPPVVAVVRAWAAARVVDSERTLQEGRLALEPLLRPVLVDEVADVSADQLLIALDMHAKHTPPPNEKPVPFLGLMLSQEQGHRVVQWLSDQQGVAVALGLSIEAWSKKLSEGFARTLESIRGRPLGDVATAVGQQLTADPLKTAAAGFAGGVDPSKSDKAGLRGVLALRDFKKS